jgi:hypothetical protein
LVVQVCCWAVQSNSFKRHYFNTCIEQVSD